jgi:peptidoglycan/LPS O-acetylase OafA/YrhL
MILLSNVTIINYLHNEKYFDYRFVLINFIFLGSLLYLIEKENFTNFKNNFITFLAFIFSISISPLFKIFDFNFLFGSIFASIFFMIFYIIDNTKFKIKSNKFITFLGDISYPIYLLHLMIYQDLYNIFLNSYVATSIIFIAICFAVNIFIEKPIINWLKKYSN